MKLRFNLWVYSKTFVTRITKKLQTDLAEIFTEGFKVWLGPVYDWLDFGENKWCSHPTNTTENWHTVGGGLRCPKCPSSQLQQALDFGVAMSSQQSVDFRVQVQRLSNGSLVAVFIGPSNNRNLTSAMALVPGGEPASSMTSQTTWQTRHEQ